MLAYSTIDSETVPRLYQGGKWSLVKEGLFASEMWGNEG